MGTLNVEYTNFEYGNGSSNTSLRKEDFKKFNTSILGINNISKGGEYIEALAAIYDLEGFTDFCNQIDSHLVIPEYLGRFLTWLFVKIANEFKKEEKDGRVILWNALPFFAKFLGDGMLFLWDTRNCSDPIEIGNIVTNLHIICGAYRKEFLPDISKEVAKPPPALRCGVARGQVISIGNKDDYVGSCINVAARLQKVSRLSFAFARRGFDPEKCFGEDIRTELIAKKVNIPGVGSGELILVYKTEYDALPLKEKSIFQDP